MLFYSQSKGEWTDENGQVISSGWYAGGNLGTNPVAVNNPRYQAFVNTGPLPQNEYTIGTLAVKKGHGPAMTLTPVHDGPMMGRAGFLLHLNNPTRPPQSSSEGCPVAPSHDELQKIEDLRAKGETQVTVTA